MRSLLRQVLAVAVLVLLVASVGAVATSVAEAADEPSWAYSLWHEVMSPYCPGRTLAECPSPQADELRIWILTQAAAGASREEVEAGLYARFGDEIRTTPKAEGWGLAAYVIPVVAFVCIGGFLLIVLRRLAGDSGASETSGAGESSPAPLEPAISPVLRAAPAGVGYSDAELERMIDEEFGE